MVVECESRVCAYELCGAGVGGVEGQRDGIVADDEE